ncbi:serine/arginine repetitive matrix protein 2 isoform X2 [Procambarus clarkii]|uniref:serine/arginine repetitive matrix protein 2 isoform X2 n=1 Tax=Procambarus clarkii TaxID=6728 RepID=UPI001E675956|nr:uncharacterized protein LOC123770557 isoform X2 [Procambarus clarkii]
MVCEAPRTRTLLVSRRGGFLEDPFFRDAWGDYNNAVRRIVDRFNHGGMFAPRDRLRDSHYHTMYRTLRSARINYAAQAAAFKDQGDVYKLVMDVREFVGGDLTVRTAGGTLSVRGRLETGGDGDGQSSSSKASSARTLHRRFNLPPDADGEKVESTLSRDAVLTVTIPKRTDVRVIPVTVEAEAEGGRSGTKRHSVTQPDPGPTPSKRPQDPYTQGHQHSASRDRSTSGRRHTFGESPSAERNRDEGLRTKETTTRRRVNDTDDDLDHRRKSYPEGATPRSTSIDAGGSRRRNRDIAEDPEDKGCHRSRRRTSKYEEATEINIPIRLERVDDAETVAELPATKAFQGLATARPSIHKDAAIRSQEQESVGERPVVHQNTESKTPKTSGNTSCDFTSAKDRPNNNNFRDKENIKPSEVITPWTYSNIYVKQSEGGGEGSELRTNDPKLNVNKEQASQRKYPKRQEEVEVVTPDDTVPASAQINKPLQHKPDKDGTRESFKHPDILPKQNKAEESQKKTPDHNNYLRNSSQDSPQSRDKSPIVGREVKVEQKQSDMEGDMFKDCWQNFSSTLQEVLARLQELSSELGQSKPATKTSPSSSAESSANSSRQTPHDTPKEPSSTQVSSRNSPSEEVCGSQMRRASGERGSTVGVGKTPPTTCPPVYADGRSPTRSGLDTQGTTHAKDLATHARDIAMHAKDVAKHSHILMNSAQEGERSGASKPGIDGPCGPCGPCGPRPRPTSLDVAHQGSLLKALRKSSPVDALKDRFLSQLTPTSEGSPAGTDVHYIPVAVEASKTVPTARCVDAPHTPAAAESLHTPAAPRHTPAAVPLCQRRGKGVDSLLIVEDNDSSVSSSEEEASPGEESSEAASSEGGGEGAAKRRDQLTDNLTAGNSNALDGSLDRLKRGCSSGEAGEADSPASLRGVSSQSLRLSPSDGDADVDKLISQAQRVIKETRRLSATNDPPFVNDLGHDTGRRNKCAAAAAGYNLAPNIASPESNLVEVEEECGGAEETVVEGCLSIPLRGARPRRTTTPVRPRPAPPTADNCLLIEPLAEGDDVAEETRPTKVTSPEIQSSDVMGCERRGGGGGRPSLHGEGRPSLHGEGRPSLVAPSALSHQRPPSARDRMGGFFSRPRSDLPPPPTAVTPPTPPTPPTPRARERSCTPLDEPHVPSYVRQKSEPSRRYSGFGHVQLDNVRKMREAWSSKQQSPPRQHQRQQSLPRQQQGRESPTRHQQRRESPTRHQQRQESPTRHQQRQESSPRHQQRRESPTRHQQRQESSPRHQQRQESSPRHHQRQESSPRHQERQESSPRHKERQESSPRHQQESSPRHHQRQESPPRHQQGRREKRVPPSPPPSPKRPADTPLAKNSPTPARRSPTNNYSKPTLSSRNRSSASPRRGSASSTEGASPATRDGSRSASARSGRPQADSYSSGAAAAGRRGSPARAARSSPPPASPFHQKLFRRLRNASLQPDSETISFTEEDDRYKLVMDVEEYVPGEIEVVQDDKHLTVKGRLESTHDGHTTTRTFNRNFHIPHNTREEDIDSALSKDGILTVYVPKKKERVIKIELTD